MFSLHRLLVQVHQDMDRKGEEVADWTELVSNLWDTYLPHFMHKKEISNEVKDSIIFSSEVSSDKGGEEMENSGQKDEVATIYSNAEGNSHHTQSVQDCKYHSHY